MVDADRLKGIGKQAAGSVKQAVGKVVGDKKLEAEGSTEKMSERSRMQSVALKTPLVRQSGNNIKARRAVCSSGLSVR